MTTLPWPMSLGVGSHVESETSKCGICREPIVHGRRIDVFDIGLPLFTIGMFGVVEDHGLCGLMMFGSYRSPVGPLPVGIRVRNDRAWLVGIGLEVPFEEISDCVWSKITLDDFRWSDDE